MSYAVDASRPDRTRYVFDPPDDFEVEVRRVESRGHYLFHHELSAALHSAAWEYFDGLTDGQFMMFCVAMARSIVEAAGGDVPNGGDFTYATGRINGRLYVRFSTPFPIAVELRKLPTLDAYCPCPCLYGDAADAAYAYLESLDVAGMGAFVAAVMGRYLELIQSPPIDPPSGEA